MCCGEFLLNAEIVTGRVENVILHLIHAAPSAVWHKQNRHIGSCWLTVYCFHPAFKNAKHLGQVEIPVLQVKFSKNLVNVITLEQGHLGSPINLHLHKKQLNLYRLWQQLFNCKWFNGM